jgi:hypothetical protein
MCKSVRLSIGLLGGCPRIGSTADLNTYPIQGKRIDILSVIRWRLVFE